MSDHRLLISKRVIEELRDRARAARPQECCGLLVGRRDPVAIVTRTVPAKNIHEQPERFFTLDPAPHFALLREVGEAAIIGHYHSHPNGPAAPSPRDLADAHDADMIWLLIDGASGDLAGFQPISDESGRVTGFAPMTLIESP